MCSGLLFSPPISASSRCAASPRPLGTNANASSTRLRKKDRPSPAASPATCPALLSLQTGHTAHGGDSVSFATTGVPVGAGVAGTAVATTEATASDCTGAPTTSVRTCAAAVSLVPQNATDASPPPLTSVPFVVTAREDTTLPPCPTPDTEEAAATSQTHTMPSAAPVATLPPGRAATDRSAPPHPFSSTAAAPSPHTRSPSALMPATRPSGSAVQRRTAKSAGWRKEAASVAAAVFQSFTEPPSEQLTRRPSGSSDKSVTAVSCPAKASDSAPRAASQRRMRPSALAVAMRPSGNACRQRTAAFVSTCATAPVEGGAHTLMNPSADAVATRPSGSGVTPTMAWRCAAMSDVRTSESVSHELRRASPSLSSAPPTNSHSAPSALHGRRQDRRRRGKRWWRRRRWWAERSVEPPRGILPYPRSPPASATLLTSAASKSNANQ
eukprot:Rhum_TRINITY_DN13084_c0_g1::Rhum_TRINITY_DN13084_c0_g1_i1::g.56749::m.56749